MDRRYLPMSDEFLCSRCRAWRPTYGSKYLPKPNDPLHADRVCEQCSEKGQSK